MPVLANHFIGNLNNTIVLDVKEVSSLSTLTMHMLRAARSIVKKYGGKIVIVNMPEDLSDKSSLKML